MKALYLISAFVDGAIVGCASALLFTPKKGSDLRSDIAALLRRKGIKISDAEVDALVAELAGGE